MKPKSEGGNMKTLNDVIEEPERRYGRWGGNPDGIPENKTHCIEKVWVAGAWKDSQCSRKRGHGRDSLFCFQHAKKSSGCWTDDIENEVKL